MLGFVNEYVYFCHVVKLYKETVGINKAGLNIFMNSAKMTEIIMS